MRLKLRTDLALEVIEAKSDDTRELTQLEGVIARTEMIGGIEATCVEIVNEEGARALQKPVGRYITLEIENVNFIGRMELRRFANAVSKSIENVIGVRKKKKVLIIGLGNPNISSDSIGPKTVNRIVVTRHLSKTDEIKHANMAQISAIQAGVPGLTGIQSAEMISGIVEKTEPDLIVVIDALATNSTDRLCSAIQITNTGILPGSGIGNRQTAINESTLGVPVIAMGVPTVIDTRFVINEFLEKTGFNIKSEQYESEYDFIATPKDIDISVKRIAKLLAFAINTSFCPELTESEIEELMEY